MAARTTRRLTDHDKEVSRRVWERRRFKGMSQVELARALGITYQQVHKYENAQNRIPAGRMVAIAEVLDTPIEWFFRSSMVRKAA